MRGRPCPLLDFVAPPALVTTLHASVYALQVALGVYALRVEPSSSVAVIGPGLTVWWACMCIFGGLLGVSGCVPGVWWVEKLGLTLVSWSAVIQLVVLTQGVRSPGHATALVSVVALLSVRWLRIRSAGLDPARRRLYLRPAPPFVSHRR